MVLQDSERIETARDLAADLGLWDMKQGSKVGTSVRIQSSLRVQAGTGETREYSIQHARGFSRGVSVIGRACRRCRAII